MDRRRARAAALAALLVVATACSVGPARRVERGKTAPTTSPSARAADAIAWDRCGDGLECGRLAVPLSATKPSLGTIELAVARHRATGKRIGALLTNPGGPGAAALWMAQQAEQIFPSSVLQHFDIVAWDPRGVGRST